MKNILVIVVALFLVSSSFAQDSLPTHLVGKIKYPALNIHPFTGVIDVDYNAMKYDASLEYKVVIDVYDKIKDSTQILSPIREVARIYNLNIANGVPKEKIKMAAVVHYLAVNAILSNEEYKAKYGVDNPNAKAVRILKDAGVNFYVCGQNLGMFNLKKKQLLSEIDVALSAKNALITLDQRGYTYMDVNEDQ